MLESGGQSGYVWTTEELTDNMLTSEYEYGDKRVDEKRVE